MSRLAGSTFECNVSGQCTIELGNRKGMTRVCLGLIVVGQHISHKLN